MISVSCHIEPVWDSLERIINETEASLDEFGRELTDVSVMAATELVENAIKYGDNKAEIKFAITADDRQIQITVSNAVRTPHDYEEVKRHIDKIRTSDNLHALFADRLRTLSEMENKIMRTRLGLIRIADEGCFKITYNLKNEFLTITAANDLKNWEKDLTDG